MQNPRLASRYAKSIIDLALEKGQVDAICNDMKLLDTVCKTNADFVAMLRSPVIFADKKIAIVKEVFGNNINVITSAFVSLLVEKGREENLPEIAVAYVTQYNEMKKIKLVKLTTASAIQPEMRSMFEKKVAGFMPDHSVAFETAVDEHLIGGFVLEVEDKLFDASILKGLNDIRAQIIDTSYVSKLR